MIEIYIKNVYTCISTTMLPSLPVKWPNTRIRIFRVNLLWYVLWLRQIVNQTTSFLTVNCINIVIHFINIYKIIFLTIKLIMNVSNSLKSSTSLHVSKKKIYIYIVSQKNKIIKFWNPLKTLFFWACNYHFLKLYCETLFYNVFLFFSFLINYHLETLFVLFLVRSLCTLIVTSYNECSDVYDVNLVAAQSWDIVAFIYHIK